VPIQSVNPIRNYRQIMNQDQNRKRDKDNSTFKEYISDDQILLQELLTEKGFSKAVIKDVLDSGYLAMQADTFVAGKSMHVVDGFYGSKTLYGLIPLGIFCEYLRRPRESFAFPKMRKRYKVRSVDEAINRLRNDLNEPFFSAGEMAFRGQTRRHTIKRPIPNPSARDIHGNEDLILPSYWRKFLHSFIDRPATIKSETIRAFFSDPLLRGKIPEDALRTIENFESYGYHEMEETFVWGKVNDPTLAETIYNRIAPEQYVRLTKQGRLLRQLPLTQQHYGIATAGIDVTFDLATACFFALNSFRLGEGDKGFFHRMRKNINPIVYGFVFHDPPLTKTRDLVQSFDWFEHLKPIRPIRQRCAIVGTDSFSVNVAVPDIAVIFELDRNFKDKNIPDQNYLFPNKDEDPFYSYLLEKRKTNQAWKEVVEYAT
jgi:hypothetical protein